jgi:tetratricopeptide (TPR) repeat protein
MDSLITAAARALSQGDPLSALKHVALREDPPALALRGIAMAQLGDLPRAKALLQRAARAFGPREPLARARCVVAEAEVALASRDLGWPQKALEAARLTLDAHGDRLNGAHARLLGVRRLLLIGRLDEAERALQPLDAANWPPALRAIRELAATGIAMRRLQAQQARLSLQRARHAAHDTGIGALAAEIEATARLLDSTAARAIERGAERSLRLDEVESLLASDALIVDACRHALRQGEVIVSLASRPLLFALLRQLGEAWPGDVSRQHLIAQAFRTRYADDSHRARLRVEIGRLRRLLKPLAELRATATGFALHPRRADDVLLLLPPADAAHAAVLALLADGESWSSSALALALSCSQRSVQRALDALAAAGKVEALGRGRARRWMMPPLPAFTTSLLLRAPLPAD